MESVAGAAEKSVFISVYASRADALTDDSEYSVRLTLDRWLRVVHATRIDWYPGTAARCRVEHAQCEATLDLFDKAVEEQDSIRRADAAFSAGNDAGAELNKDLLEIAPLFAYAADPACTTWLVQVDTSSN